MMANLMIKRSRFKEVIRGFGFAFMGVGIDPRKLRAIRYIPKYFADRAAFSRAGGVVTNTYPVFDDFTQQAGSARGHYFHQDLLVATFINSAKPIRHIDIGSRIDGFVAHVASFREIEVLDIRPLTDVGHPNIKFMQADLMSENKDAEAIADSVSCLHALEHFGLGRYGDPIDPQGHIKAFNNLCKMLKQHGTLYISFPIGQENSVFFNANRSFHPRELLVWAKGILELVRFDFVDDEGKLIQNWPLAEKLPATIDGCGIYTLRKL